MPYVIYFIATIVYVEKWAVFGIDVGTTWDLTAEFFCRFVIIFCVLYFMFFELVAIIRDPAGYMRDVYNIFDWSAFILNVYIIYTSAFDPLTKSEEEK